jgi:hypothetical protein
MRGHRRAIVLTVPPGENAAVDLRVQRFDAVTSEMPMTGSPACASARAVPPVDTSSHPRWTSAAANGIRPDLSETLSKARIGMSVPQERDGCHLCGNLLDKPRGRD